MTNSKNFISSDNNNQSNKRLNFLDGITANNTIKTHIILSEFKECLVNENGALDCEKGYESFIQNKDFFFSDTFIRYIENTEAKYNVTNNPIVSSALLLIYNHYLMLQNHLNYDKDNKSNSKSLVIRYDINKLVLKFKSEIRDDGREEIIFRDNLNNFLSENFTEYIIDFIEEDFYIPKQGIPEKKHPLKLKFLRKELIKNFILNSNEYKEKTIETGILKKIYPKISIHENTSQLKDQVETIINKSKEQVSQGYIIAKKYKDQLKEALEEINFLKLQNNYKDDKVKKLELKVNELYEIINKLKKDKSLSKEDFIALNIDVDSYDKNGKAIKKH